LLQAIPQLPEIVKAYYEQFQDFNEGEKAKALSQLLTEVTLTLLPPMPKLSFGQIFGLKNKLSKAAEKVVIGESKIAIKFGTTENQIYHIFRHTDVLGLDRSLVESTIQNHFKTVASQVVAGKPLNHLVEIWAKNTVYCF
jgi:hypothetical protein